MASKHSAGRFRNYVEQIAPDGDIEQLKPEPSPLESIADGEASLAASAIDKLRRDEAPSYEESAAFEAIIRPKTRPIVDVVNSSYGRPAEPWTHYDEPGVRARLEPAIPSVGRIDVPDLNVEFAGTGFIVGNNLMMTNRHVARLFAAGVGAGELRFTHSASVNFLYEKDRPGTESFEFTEVVMVHPYWDMALLRVAGLENVAALTLTHRAPEELEGNDIAVIGYPARDPRNNVRLQDRIFGGIYNIKRLQPGKLWERRTVSSFKNNVDAVTHDCSTLGGNSGSAVVLAASGEVAALHFAGRFRDANFAVPSYELARDARVVAAGVNFAGSVPATGDWDDAWRSAHGKRKATVYLSSELAPPDEDDDEPDATRPAASATIRQSGDERSMTLTIPLTAEPVHITISVGDRTTALTRRAAAAMDVETEAAHKISPDPDFASRPGYRDDFLGWDHVVPVPYLSEDLYSDVALNERADEEPHLLKYHHFSVCMSKSRKIAYFTACNMDGTKEVNIPRGSDRWFLDPRIPAGYQLATGAYAGTQFDRGHLVKRIDPVWGDEYEEARLAHDDTFHWTNCSPQHAKYNRNRKTWAKVENYILNRTTRDDRKASAFTGPVFRDDDPIIITPKDVEVQIPLEFWKVVFCVNEDGELAASGFLISQEEIVNAYLESLEFPVTDDVKPFQVPIRELEELTGLSFGELTDCDTLAGDTESATVGRRLILSLEDIV